MKQPAIIKEISKGGQQAATSTDDRMIHPHTYIHPNARVATNVKIDPFSVIHQDVEVGEEVPVANQDIDTGGATQRHANGPK